MIFEAFQNWVLSINLSYSVIIFIVVLTDFTINILYISIFGNKDILRAFFSDTVAMIWPLFVFAPSIVLLISSFRIEHELQIKFPIINYSYYPISGKIDPILVDLVFLLIIGTSLFFDIRSKIRIKKRHNHSTWLTKVKGLIWIRGIVDFIVHFSIIISSIIYVYHWFTFYKFFTSNWQPNTILFNDLYYGIEWIKNILLLEFALITLISFSSLIVAFRERKFGKVIDYVIGFILPILTIAVFAIILVTSMNNFLLNTRTNILSEIIDQTNYYYSNSHGIINNPELITLSFYYNQTAQLPVSLSLPSWFESVIFLRLLFLLLEIIEVVSNGKIQFVNIIKKFVKAMAQ